MGHFTGFMGYFGYGMGYSENFLGYFREVMFLLPFFAKIMNHP
jgi:hypothetical protein